jgi:hypothetical protein
MGTVKDTFISKVFLQVLYSSMFLVSLIIADLIGGRQNI